MMKQNQWAALFRQAHAQKMAGDAYKQTSNDIKDALAEANLTTMTAGGFTATVKEVSSNTVDWKRFMADHPELMEEIDKYRTTSTTTRLYLK